MSYPSTAPKSAPAARRDFRCPHCRLPLRKPGRLVAAVDAAGVEIVFAICAPCTARLDRLPPQLQRRAHERDLARVASAPDSHAWRAFKDATEARLFTALGADLRDPAAIIALFE